MLYIVYWGAAEPLGQSLVLPAVKRLAALGADLTLVTFEKSADLARTSEIGSIRANLNEHDVDWIPLRYHKRPKIPATAFDFFHGCARGIAAKLRCRPDIVHARTFVGGLMGLATASLLRARLIYHNEGFYPDEQVDAGVWQVNSAPHRVAKFLEQQLYLRADAVIALSSKAKVAIEGLATMRTRRTPVIVVPSCVDLNHFRWNRSKTLAQGEELRFVYIGGVGGRYDLERVGRFVAIVSSMVKRAHFRILTRSDPNLVASMLSTLSDDAWSMGTVPYSAMPDELAREHVGLHFLRQGQADHAGSPTKIGEYWAAGLPVVVTPNAGDTDEIIRRERVGVIVNEHSDEAYARALAELRSLLKDDQLPARCRRAAEIHYALEPACERQINLYHGLLSRATEPAAGAYSIEDDAR